MQNSNSGPINQLPRLSLREKAFRKYERYLARALHESFTIDPFAEMNLKPHSFVLGFKDAILGFRRFGYDSILIPKGADFRGIKLYELSDDAINIVNQNLTAAIQQTATLHALKDFTVIKNLAAAFHRHERDGECFVQFDSLAEEKVILDLAQPIGDYDINIKRHSDNLLVIRQ